MPFLLPLLLLAPQAYDPEVEAVMNRKRKERAEASAAAVAPVAQASDGRIPVPYRYAAKFQVCLDQAAEAPDKGVAFAAQWRLEENGRVSCRERVVQLV